MVFGTILERNHSGTCIPLLQCHSDNPLDISYGDISQWQWMSGWQGGLEEKENYIPVPDAPLCAVPAMAGELGAFTFAKVLGRKSTVVIGRVQVFWGWDAVSSRIFLNRYFCSILFVQKLGKNQEYFFLFLAWLCQLGFCWFKCSSSVTFIFCACEMWKMLLTQAKTQAPSAHILDTTLTWHVWCCIFLSQWQSGSESYCIHLRMEQNESHSIQHSVPFLLCPQSLRYHLWMQRTEKRSEHLKQGLEVPSQNLRPKMKSAGMHWENSHRSSFAGGMASAFVPRSQFIHT